VPLNYKDVLIAIGKLSGFNNTTIGMECAGFVIQSKNSDFNIGDTGI
jgi:hypothetical protein